MKLNRIKINSYGNLQNKEIEFNKLNIIFGENEAGKTTLQNFIMSMFYGIEKKKGKEPFSDVEKYTPWQGTSDFSGKITYELDDNTKYEVFRDFTKKNPEIYDETGKDISKDFSISISDSLSSEEVGSSNNKIGGSFKNILAIANFCLSPAGNPFSFKFTSLSLSNIFKAFTFFAAS